jgi:hypothetical protein
MPSEISASATMISRSRRLKYRRTSSRIRGKKM